MKIYVGNLANNVTEQELNDLFVSYGAVLSARIIKDKFSGQSRGFGFVEMDDAEAANASISGLNGSEVKGQRIRVSEARPPQERGGFGERRSGGGDRGGFGGNRGGSRGGFGGGRDNRFRN